MDDKRAFERQLTRIASEMAGPIRPVDADALVRSAKAGPVGRWSVHLRGLGLPMTLHAERGFSMFAALKFIVAGGIVALVGGFLLVGGLDPRPTGEALPAAVTGSLPPAEEQRLVSGREVIDPLLEQVAAPQTQWGHLTQHHGWVRTPSIRMDDPWVNGAGRYVSDVDIIGASRDGAGNMRGGVSRDRGTLPIENDGGAWEGPCDSVSTDGGAHIVGSCVLSGSGTYEGYTYLRVHDWGTDGTTEGVILPGEHQTGYPSLPPRPGS